jgi:transposase InsO family protein
MPRSQRTYDHRLRDLVQRTRDVILATSLGVPRSTAAGWLRQPGRTTVTLDVLSKDAQDLQAEVIRLRRRIQKLRAVVRLLVALLRTFQVDLARRRLPDGEAKSGLLRAIEQAQQALTLRTVLRILGLSSSRFHAWKRAETACELDKHSSCPRISPHRLMVNEIETIREMVTSPRYRHVPTGTLAILAQRLGRVFASPTTWRRLVHERGWRRPRLRIHPAKPKIGIRATRPNETWHIDTTIVRLLDGTRAYLHAVIDNYSRRILSWRVAGRFDPANTVATLLAAGRSRSPEGEPPTVLSDGGVENVNQSIDELINSGVLRRVLAMTELRFSNSMIEAWWRALKHQWLYLNSLDSVEKVRQLVDFYVEEHNERLPHSAFRGQTPDEMYFGNGDAVPEELEAAKRAARQKRPDVNRALLCPVCDPTGRSNAA